jgi:hypothetical protein
MVNQLTSYPKFKGSNPVAAGTGREERVGKNAIYSFI